MRHAFVVPIYNKAPYVRRAIDSIASQRRKVFEIILVDDASTDGSLDEVRRSLAARAQDLRDVRVRVLELAKNGGPSAARNAGLAEVTADWVTLFDADDEYAEDFTLRAAQIVERHAPDLVVLGYTQSPSGEREPDIASFRGGLARIDASLYRIPDPLPVITASDFALGPGGNVLCRAELLRGHRYDEGSRFFEGVDFWYRVLRSACARGNARCLLETRSYLRLHETAGSLSRAPVRDPEGVVLPGILRRLWDSDDPYDVRLWTVIADRWWWGMLSLFEDRRARAVFAWRHRRVFATLAARSLLRPVRRHARRT